MLLKRKKIREKRNTAEWYDLPPNGAEMKFKLKPIRSISDYDSESVSSKNSTKNSSKFSENLRNSSFFSNVIAKSSSNWLKAIEKIQNRQAKFFPEKNGGKILNFPKVGENSYFSNVGENSYFSNVGENSYFSDIESAPEMKPKIQSLAALMEKMKFQAHFQVTTQKSKLGDEELVNLKFSVQI